MRSVADRLKKRTTEVKPEIQAPERGLRILVLAISLGDRLVLEHLGRQHNWELKFTDSPREGFALASRSHFGLILCDRNQNGYPWREVMDLLATCSPRSCILL